ncbi:MAG: TonB-dependent receptor [Bacteroidetes bacterium]|nr:TonB-dependent receptor [Bacteroidota bacterium]
MKNWLLLAAGLLFEVTCSTAHPAVRDVFSITGKVLDENKQPVSFASVTLLNAADSSLIKGEVSDEAGDFDIENISAGNYILNISFLGYEPYSREINVVQSTDVGAIDLMKVSASLQEVVVTAAKPLLERENDKIVMNVESSALASAGNALDVLQRAPGVIVDNDGNIRLKGKQGVLVMIDGKETYLSPDQLAAQLRNTAAETISKVEVISNPGAKYEAQGSAGIINIVTKKNRRQGFNGSVNGSAARGESWSYDCGLNLNYRDKKFNLFGNYNYSNDDQVQQRDIWRNVNYEGELTRIHDDNVQTNHYNDNNFKAGIDYFINEKNTLGFVASGYVFHEKDDNFTDVTVFNSNDVVESSSTSEGDINDRFNNISLNLNYNAKFDSLGRELTVNADYAYYDGLNNDTYTTTYFNTEGNQTGDPDYLNNYNPTTVDIKSLKLDYTQPLNSKLKLEAGGKFSYVITDNDLQVTQLENNEWVNDPTRSNHFRYTENINAAYVNLAAQFKKLSLQAGLRGEQTIANGNSITIDNTFDRNYFQLFPSLSLNYAMNDNNSFGFSYSRRIDRPRYQSLNPFVFYLDQYLLGVGNPNLKPQLTQSVSLSYTLKQKYTVSLDYSYTVDNIIDLFYQNDSTRVVYEKPDNFDHQHYVDASFFAPIDVTKWWSVTPAVTVYYITETEQYESTVFTKSDVSWNGNLQNNFRLPDGFSLDVSAFYQSSGIWSIAEFKAFGSVDAGVKKNVLKDNGTIRLSVQDIFNTNHINGTIQYANLDGSVIQHNDTRQAKLTFTYRFGKQTEQRRHDGGNEEEKSRVGAGH